MKSLIIAVLLTLTPVLVHAEQFVDAGDYRIHYAAINSTELTPQIARQFSVDRSRNQILLVFNAQHRVEGQYQSVPATAKAFATTLLGHRQTLTLRPIREADVHYVVANFETLDGEFMTISAEVTPQGARAPVEVKFKQQFYRD
ncbi:DUF4426 domain-containing protein [Sinimarinibacterium sp. NLF-5-8]|uniref:DUF4426 domain-containing protein n=1 Tax=Sinimarinibacterium sp. NLF-5-8 TaxID=2698684 RepID=UPI00137C3749|nr:DUF4426 domain-containing protein [Sinimarinibacterium sp. NLF-5-8]QHS10363.1 DUF4426 domain-containing protein [Sinimarinibacterium sp. NLF-5-8]